MKKIVSLLFVFFASLSLIAQDNVQAIDSVNNNSEVVIYSDNERPVLPADTRLNETDDYLEAKRLRASAVTNENEGEYITSYEESQAGILKANKLKGEAFYIVMPFRLEKMRIESEKALASYRAKGFNTNSLSRKLYSFSVTNYNSATNLMRESKTITNDRASLSNNYINTVAYFNDVIDANSTINAIIKVDDDRNYLVKNQYLKKNDSNNTMVTTLLNESSDYFVNGDKDNSKNKVAEADSLIAKLKEKADADIAYAYAYATVKYLEKNHKNKMKTPEYTNAMDSLYNANDLLTEEKFKDSISESKNVMKIIDELANFTFLLPQYYTVIKRPFKTDTLWRIASYDFVYKNLKLWPKLYDANKETFVEPSNPNLIEKDQVLFIPNLNTELRDGEYNPKKKYIILSERPKTPPALPKR